MFNRLQFSPAFNKAIALFFTFFMIVSCNNKYETKEYYDSNDNLDSVVSYNDNLEKSVIIIKDENTKYVKSYHENSKMSYEGVYYKKLKNGFWKYYDNEGVLDKAFEYKNICGEQHTNQVIYFTKTGDTIKNKSNFVKIEYKENLKINEITRILFKYHRVLSKKSKLELVFSQDFNEYFSNIDSVEKTNLFTNVDGFLIKMKYISAGKRIIRGYIKEFEDRSYDSLKDETTIAERFVYFEMSFDVK